MIHHQARPFFRSAQVIRGSRLSFTHNSTTMQPLKSAVKNVKKHPKRKTNVLRETPAPELTKQGSTIISMLSPPWELIISHWIKNQPLIFLSPQVLLKHIFFPY